MKPTTRIENQPSPDTSVLQNEYAETVTECQQKKPTACSNCHACGPNMSPRGEMVDFWPHPVVITKNNFKYKSLSNFACNLAVGCPHGCPFCYVPDVATNKQKVGLAKFGVDDPDADWGKYDLIRLWNEKKFLASLKKAENTPLDKLKRDGHRAIIFCSTTDAYHNPVHLDIGRQKELASALNANRRRALELIRDHSTLNVRILTRSPLARQDFDLFKSFGARLAFGMSLPTLNVELSQIYEPSVASPAIRLETLRLAKEYGLNVFAAMAPTFPECDEKDLRATLKAIANINPITIFHEPVNIRAKNVARIEAAGKKHSVALKTEVFATPVEWQKYAIHSLKTVERIANELGIQDRLHLWPDKTLGSKTAKKSQPDPLAYKAWVDQWWKRISEWPSATSSPTDVSGTDASVATTAVVPAITITQKVEPVANSIVGNGESGESNSSNSPDSPAPHTTPSAPYYPEASLIGKIIDYLYGQIETPKLFITAGALTLVSVVLNRKVFFRWGDKLHYPNLYQVLVGPSGITRKSDLTSRIDEILAELWSECMLADFTSVERLIESFAQQPIRAIVQSEGKMFIDKLNQSPSLANAIIKLYDCENLSTDFKKDKSHREKTKSFRKKACESDGGRITAENTLLTILTGIVPEAWRVSDSNQISGLMGRFQLLFANKREHEILTAPMVRPEDRHHLIKSLRDLGQFHGEMRLSPEAQQAFLEIQRDNRLRMDSAPDVVNSNLSRMPFTIIKVAMLYEVAMSGNLTISLEALQLAQTFVELGHRSYVEFFYEMDMSRKQARLIERIIQILQRNQGRVAHSDLLKQATRHGECHAHEFKEALKVLAEREEIRFEDNPQAHYRDIVLVDPTHQSVEIK